MFNKFDAETEKSLSSLAQMLEYENVDAVMSVIAEKLLVNLAYTNCD